MKTAITYTVLSLLNLIGFVIGICLLPAQVPIHFNINMVADAIGSPWVYVSLPAAAALISAAIWTTTVSKKEKNRKIISGVLAGLGAILVCMGWAFFALIASGVEAGEQVDFPFALVTVLPFSLLMIFFGNYMPRVEQNFWLGIRIPATLKSETVWAKTHRLGGFLFIAAGLISAISAVVLSCVGNLAFVSVIVLVATLLLSAFICVVYALTLYRKEKENPSE